VKTLITGIVSMSNRGTAAILLSVAAGLRARLPDLTLEVELFYPEKQDMQEHLATLGMTVTPPVIQSPLRAGGVLLLAGASAALRKVGLKCTFRSRTLRRYSEAGTIVDLSAEAFVWYYTTGVVDQVRRFLIHIYPLWLAGLMGTPVIIYAQSLGPWAFFGPLLRRIVKRAASVTVRDPTSLDRLAKEGIDVSRVQITPDPAFLLPSAGEEKVQDYLEREGIDVAAVRRKGYRVIGICLGQVLDPAEHSSLMQEVAQALKRLSQGQRTYFLFVPNSYNTLSEKSGDVCVGYELRGLAGEGVEIGVVAGHYGPGELKGMLQVCDLVISLRMHPVIGGLSLGIPCILIAFNDKAYGLFGLYGLERYVVRCDEVAADSLAKLAEVALSESMALRRSIAQRTAWLCERSGLGLDLLAELVRGATASTVTQHSHGHSQERRRGL